MTETFRSGGPNAEGKDGFVQLPVHIINHTHWDREWFLTHEYTTAWIPELVDNLRELAERSSEYEYLFDGQTLVIEDLLREDPSYRTTVEELVAKQHLRIGPLYSQPDWRLLSGELLFRNIVYGSRDAAELGGPADVAWLVDTFGHLSQAPQMLSLTGIDAAYVWRGVPEMHPAFSWRSPNGTAIATVNLFGGYRNLYGVSRTHDIAVERLVAEVDKLAPYYNGAPIPLFDGYDLDTEPEDPIGLYAEAADVPAHIDLHASSARRYVEDLLEHHSDPLPTIEGELLSGRYGAVFPGSLSSRTYLKVMHHDAERALIARAEPLAVLAWLRGEEPPVEQFERTSRTLLQNGVHDCICGVSIDQVHERMDWSYRREIAAMNEVSERSIARILAGFAPHTYAVSTSPSAMRTSVRWQDRVAVIESDAVGVRPIEHIHAVERIDEVVPEFRWSNAHYEAVIDCDGLRVDGLPVGRLRVRAEHGDTYSSEPGEIIGRCEIVGDVVVESTSPIDTVVRFDVALRTVRDLEVTASISARFDDGPLVRLTVDLDSVGTDFRVDLDVDTGVSADRAFAAMPFDAVERRHVDTDLLEPEIDPGLAGVLMGQREVEAVDEFPFHDFVALRSDERTVAVMALGVHSYTSSPSGTISLPLRRSVEWLARSSLPHRAGDAGPAMYVPGARCERRVRHEIAVAYAGTDDSATSLFALAASFHAPPLIAEVEGGDAGGATRWDAFTSPLPTTSISVVDGRTVARVFRPEATACALPATVERVSPRGGVLGDIDEVAPFSIVDLVLEPIPPPPTAQTPHGAAGTAARVTVHGLPDRRVGDDRSRPSADTLAQLERHRDELAQRLIATDADLARATGDERHRLQHRHHVLAREIAEFDLSLELNRRRAASDDVVSIPDQVDPVIARLGSELNDERIMRRIYDYVVQALAGR